jgi:hypothetical protein
MTDRRLGLRQVVTALSIITLRRFQAVMPTGLTVIA